MAMQAQLWTVSGLSVETGYTRRAVARALTGCPVADTKGRANCYWLKDAAPRIYGAGERKIDLGEQKARQHRAMADKLEMENARRREELVDATEMAGLWRALSTEAKQRIMMIPNRVGERLTRTSKRDAKKILEEEIRAALESLSDERAGIPGGV